MDGGLLVDGRGPMTRRRNNAPVRPPRPSSSVPDLLFALAACGWAMAAVVAAATFVSDDLSGGSAGTQLARLFAGTLALSGTFAGLVAMLLLGPRKRADHVVVPAVIGAALGCLEALLFLDAAPLLLLAAPCAVLVFTWRPLRRLISGTVTPGGGRRR